MGDLVTGGIIGFVAAVALMCLLWFLATRRTREQHRREMERYDESIIDLRQERAEDKETNRRLRHELAANTPDRLLESATRAEIDRDSALVERDQALEQLDLVQKDLAAANGRITDRETKLRQYREALKEIRISLEAQGRGTTAGAADGLIDTDTGDVPAEILAATEAAEASAAE